MFYGNKLLVVSVAWFFESTTLLTNKSFDISQCVSVRNKAKPAYAELLNPSFDISCYVLVC